MFAAGRTHLAIPGPSVIPDRVLNAMHRAAPDIYAAEMGDLTAGLARDLCRLAGTAHHVALYIANGHAAWEAALANTLAPGDRALVLASGRFGHGWADMARGLGIAVEVQDFGTERPADPDWLESRLRADRDRTIAAVLVCHVDTASSVRTDAAPLAAAIAAAGHPALLMVDAIASLGADRFEMDAAGADVLVGASQKGLMTPPGLGFVWFNPRAAARRDSLPGVSRYWDWRPRAEPAALWQYFDGTAPTHHLFGLRAALDMIGEEGLPALWHRHAVLARAVWAAADVWAAGGPLRADVPDPAHRSHAVTSLHLGGEDGARLRAWTQTVAGLTLGIGLGRTPEDAHLRIGHMGHVNATMILGALATMTAGMKALGIPHGAGALDAAAEVIAAASQ